MARELSTKMKDALRSVRDQFAALTYEEKVGEIQPFLEIYQQDNLKFFPFLAVAWPMFGDDCGRYMREHLPEEARQQEYQRMTTAHNIDAEWVTDIREALGVS